MKYADDPFWVRLRWAMFILFWALWFCMLAGAIFIIVRAPKCAPPPPKEWFEKYALIETDANLEAFEDDLGLLKDSKAGVFANVDCGADAYEVLKTPSCLVKFKESVAKAKDHGVKVIVDLIANYVPDTHEWFNRSQAREEAYENYFIWRKPDGFDGTKQNTPNNWRAVTNEAAWQYSETRGEFYLSQHGKGKADLNFTNPEVVKQFDAVLKAWMQAGAAGVRLSNARLLLVSPSMKNESFVAPGDPVPGAAAPAYTDYNFLRHTLTADQPELDALLAHFSQIVDDNASEQGAKKSVFTIKETGLQFSQELYLLNRNMSALRPPGAAAVRADAGAAALANSTLHKLARPNNTRAWPALQLTTTDASFGEDVAAFAYLLPATPVLTIAQLQQFNVSGRGDLGRLTTLREDASIQHGHTRLQAVPAVNSTEQLVTVTRWKSGHTGYVCVLNTRDELLRADLGSIPALQEQLTVHYMPGDVHNQTGYVTNKEVPRNDVAVPAKSALVLSFVPKPEET